MSCTDYLMAVVDPLISFLEPTDIGICDNNIKKHLSILDRKELDILISLISGQEPIASTYPYYSLYKINIYNKRTSHLLDIFDGSGGDHQTTIQYDDGHLVLHIFSVESLIFYIGDIKSKYIFLPVSFSSENGKSGHQTSLIIDTINKRFYLYDPNGESSYFNNIFVEAVKKNMKGSQIENNININDLYFDGTELIDILIKGYLNDIKEKLDIVYEYIPSDIWNPSKKVLNPSFGKNIIIGSGHCVITTILFLHYLHITGEDIRDAFERLGTLSSGELIYLINSYSYRIYQTLKPNFDNKMGNPKYKEMIDNLKDE